MARKTPNLNSPLIRPDVWKRFVATSISRAREPQFLANELLDAVASSETGTIERALTALAKGERDGVHYFSIEAALWDKFSARMHEIGNDPRVYLGKIIRAACADFNACSRDLCLRLFEGWNTINGLAGIEGCPARDDDAVAQRVASEAMDREREALERKQAERDGAKNLDAWYANQIAQARHILRQHRRQTKRRRRAA